MTFLAAPLLWIAVFAIRMRDHDFRGAYLDYLTLEDPFAIRFWRTYWGFAIFSLVVFLVCFFSIPGSAPRL